MQSACQVICKSHRRQTMSESITAFIGLDVHKESVAIAVARAGRTAPRFIGTTGPTLGEVQKALAHLGQPEELLVVYEAGPCGYGLARQLCGRGYRCEVVAPTLIPRKPGDRIKTDRRDALALAHFARAGDLTPITIPAEAHEAMRDLSRAREDAIRARLKARQQLKALLLRHGIRYSGKSSWTAAHERFLATVRFEHGAQNIAFVEYRAAVSEAQERVERLTTALREQIAQWPLQPLVNALMTLRGIDLVGAATLIAELGDLRRFEHPKRLMAFLGLVPSECSSG
jgi:transposase